MQIKVSILTGLTMDAAEFLRVYGVRSANVMWFLGAGASRNAGIKTANDMIWDFKREIYRSVKKLPPSVVADASDFIRQKIQSYFDELGSFPSSGANDEYARYFEETYPHANDRRIYLDNLIKGGKPSYGHYALALLMRENECRVVWTTNFDRTIEDAASKIFGGTGYLTTGDLGEPVKLINALNNGRFPIYGKIHGDYQSDALKNTTQELRQQDEEMQHALVQACQNHGLAIIGYSGRDDSVMDTFSKSLKSKRSFPAGLFWFKRSEESVYSSVVKLIEQARDMGIDAHIINNESFDELMSDVVRFMPSTAGKLDILQGVFPPKLRSTPLKEPSKSVPFIRMNALPIISRPVMCRFIECNIGGWEEIEEAIKRAGVSILAKRTKGGVVAFGRDVDIRKVFLPYNIKGSETRPIPDDRLTHENSSLALIRESLFLALSKRPNIVLHRKGRTMFAVPDRVQIKASDFSEGSIHPIASICGIISGTSINWSEACALYLDYKKSQLWLLLEPRIFLHIPEETSLEHKKQAKEFVRERMAQRYNKQANALLAGWINLLVGINESLEVKGFNISDGLDPVFEISKITAYSGRS